MAPAALAFPPSSLYMRPHSTHGLWCLSGRNPADTSGGMEGQAGHGFWRNSRMSDVRGGQPERKRSMALPDFTMRQLLEAGVHFGHQTHRWNPKMKPYIFGDRNNIHIIDLSQTVPLLHQALKQVVSDTVARGGRVLFVGTKRQASDIIADAAQAFGPVLRQLALARRHADQLEDDLQLDPASAQARRDARRRSPGLHQEGAPEPRARAREAGQGSRRHQGHGRRRRT